MSIAQLTDFSAFLALSLQRAKASRFSLRIPCAAASSSQALGFRDRINRMPASKMVGSPTTLRAIRSGQCQDSGIVRAMVPGRIDQSRIPAAALSLQNASVGASARPRCGYAIQLRRADYLGKTPAKQGKA